MFALILVMGLWGTLGAFVLWSGLPAIDVAFYRCLIGALSIGLWLIKRKQKIEFSKTTLVIGLAGICLVLNWVFLFNSFQVSSITIGNVSYYLQPILLIILGVLFFKERVSPLESVFIMMAFMGVVLTVDVHNLFAANHIAYGFILALMAALLYSVLTILMKYVQENYFTIIFIQLIIGALILFPFIQVQRLSYTALACIMVICFVHTILAYFLYYKAIQKISFSQIAVMSYLDPIVAIITDMVFFDRTLNAMQFGGILLTFLSLYGLIVQKKKIKNELRYA